MRHAPLNTALLLALAITTHPGLAHEPTAPVDAAAPADEVPLYDNLGDLHYPVSTGSELAQRYFDQGLRWTYAFNHAEARRAFRAAQQHDPSCALCYWGEAFVLGPNINAPMDEAAGNPALTAIRRAQALAHHAAPHEQALIAALAERYALDGDRGSLDAAYAEAMVEANRRFPDDPEIAVLTVDALMNLSPWDYWQADGVTTKGRAGEAIAIAEQVLASHPKHPGAIHLYIHLTEASAHPEKAEPHAEKLADLMPGAGHLVHMASHTYFRIGRYADSVEVNQRAVQADEAFLARAPASEQYAHGYFPHNIHFVAASAQMIGDGATAIEYAERLPDEIPDHVAEQIGWVQAILTAPHFAHAQFTAPGQVMQLPDPGDEFPFIKGMWHYARGVASARLGDPDQAREEAARIAALRQDGDFEMLLAWAVPAPDVLDLARHVVEGRIAQAEGDHDRAAREFGIAAAIQDTIAYMEPPYWYYPVSRSQGAALLQLGRAEGAAQAFERSLEAFPENGLSLWGLAQAQQALGLTDAAAATEQRFRSSWAGDPAELDLNQL